MIRTVARNCKLIKATCETAATMVESHLTIA
jgi:hypothetical protein